MESAELAARVREQRMKYRELKKRLRLEATRVEGTAQRSSSTCAKLENRPSAPVDTSTPTPFARDDFTATTKVKGDGASTSSSPLERLNKSRLLLKPLQIALDTSLLGSTRQLSSSSPYFAVGQVSNSPHYTSPSLKTSREATLAVSSAIRAGLEAAHEEMKQATKTVSPPRAPTDKVDISNRKCMVSPP